MFFSYQGEEVCVFSQDAAALVAHICKNVVFI